jgi:peptidoglycan/xylan/chitin deacetylase (PgdA/CDA1 family)
MRFKPPIFLRKLMPDLLWEIAESGAHGVHGTLGALGAAGGDDPLNAPSGDVFLTFDDGPTPGVTEWILDTLAAHNAKATFFCLGRNAAEHPELMARIVAEGHRVGNHTYSHLKGWDCDVDRYEADVDRAAEVIHSHLFRPPYGRISPEEAHTLSERYRIVMWNIISRDYNRRLSPRRCLETVVRHVRPGDIVVFHDSRKAFRNMSYALPRTLEYLRANGMNSKAIDL